MGGSFVFVNLITDSILARQRRRLGSPSCRGGSFGSHCGDGRRLL